MKSKQILLVALFLCIGISSKSFMPVPNTETFSLLDVYNVVHAENASTTFDLASCFTYSTSSQFDATYSSYPANSLLRFRNYGATVCNGSTIYPGGEAYPTTINIELGSATGTVYLTFNEGLNPDRFMVYWNGILQINTGYWGSVDYDYGGQYRYRVRDYLITRIDPIYEIAFPNDPTHYPDDGYSRVNYGTKPTYSFSKSSSSSTATIKVYSGTTNTGWTFTLSCP